MFQVCVADYTKKKHDSGLNKFNKNELFYYFRSKIFPHV